MIKLSGENLGKRQQELNNKVNEFVKQKSSFENIQNCEEQSDVDRLFKIDVASKYRNIQYLIDILKCGDSLFISRALKCTWIYEDEYSNIINPDYLHHEVFPLMSLKMKTKLINTVASHLKNDKQAENFYNYFDKLRMDNVALKFLCLTSESFKLNYINSRSIDSIHSGGKVKNFIGTSFNLAEAFISKLEFDTAKEFFLMQMSDLYSVDKIKYLNLLEKYASTNGGIFGGRISKDIMTKHKDRVLKSPYLYIHKISKYMLAHHSTVEDAKIYIKALMPTDVKKFWTKNIYKSYKYIFDLIPKDEVFGFYKNLFKSFYGDEPFEMCHGFYLFHLFNLMTDQEREAWALKHIEEGKEILGSNKDYYWYKFVNFEQAFQAIRKYILVTTDADERNNMVMTLIYSCKNQRELEKLFNYYYERFVNESGHHKEYFFNTVNNTHNLFTFDKPCWDAFNKILYSMEVYTPGFFGKNKFRAYCVIYNIIHALDMPEALTYYLNTDIEFGQFKNYCGRLDEKQKESVYVFLFDYYLTQFEAVSDKNEKERNEKKVHYVVKFLRMLEEYKKDKTCIPKIIFEFISKNTKKFKGFSIVREECLSDESLVRLLKKDKHLVVSKLPQLKQDESNIKLRRLMKKVKLYFHNDIDKDFLQFFNKCIEGKSKVRDGMTSTAIYGIFALGNDESKNQLLLKYVPKEPKIDHRNIDRKILEIQEAICRFACYSRPPVPLQTLLLYIKGDYVHFCLPMFNLYLRKLPLPQSIDFIKAVINSPLSIQKHGLRMAFTAYDTENLKLLITNIWQKTKNVSLRFVIYKALVKKINDSNETTQDELFETLKIFTKTIYEDDTNDLYDLIISKEIPERFRAEILEITWLSLKDLPHKKSKIVSVKSKVIQWIEKCMPLMNREFCKNNIVMPHINSMLTKEGLKLAEYFEEKLNNAIWGFIAKYLIVCKNETDTKDSLSIVSLIYKEIFKHWNYVSEENERVYAKFCYNFLEMFKNKISEEDYKNKDYIIQILEEMLKSIKVFPLLHETFLLILELQLIIATRKVRREEIGNVEDMAEKLSEFLTTIIEDLKNNGRLVPSTFNTILKIIGNTVSDMVCLSDINEEIFLSYLCQKLIDSNNNDIIVLAISLLPLKYYGPEAEEKLFEKLSKDFIHKVKAIDNFEVQSFYFKKFYYDRFEI